MEFAAHYHGIIDQRRKYTGEPYIVHPAAVAEIVRSVPCTPEMLAAAYLHDVVEDTPATIEEVRVMFGAEIADMVFSLTNEGRMEEVSRAERKRVERARLAVASSGAKTVKLADILENITSIVERDPKFARVYLREKIQLLPLLRDGDPTLWFKVEAAIASACASLASAREMAVAQ